MSKKNKFQFVSNKVHLLKEMMCCKKNGLLQDASGYYRADCISCHSADKVVINPDKQIYYCFECHTSGNVISYIAIKLNKTFNEAADYLLEKYNLEDLCDVWLNEDFEE